jgi:hypothetical protein
LAMSIFLNIFLGMRYEVLGMRYEL